MRVNGKTVTGWVTVENLSTPYPSIGIPCQQSLLLFLRNDLGLNGPKYGCGLGQCGACTVLVDGRAARACVIPADGLPGRDVTTLEGLSAFGGNVGAGLGDSPAPPPVLHPVQQAFADTQAAQCGYCLNLSHNLCRCGTHIEILRAVHRAVELVADRVADKISGHSAI
jgi:nicotinate dehydrogenase subunit A